MDRTQTPRVWAVAWPSRPLTCVDVRRSRRRPPDTRATDHRRAGTRPTAAPADGAARPAANRPLQPHRHLTAMMLVVTPPPGGCDQVEL